MILNIRKRMKSQKGFTLVELMVVIAIIGILAAIAVPKLTNSANAAKDAALVADLRTVDSALALYYTTNHSYPADLAAAKTALVGSDKYLAAWPKDATGTADISYTSSDTNYDLTGIKSDGTTTIHSPGSSY